MTAELKGVPAVSVMTSAFISAAEMMARVQGMPEHPFAVIEHPVASADGDGLAERARIAASFAASVLTGRVA